MIGVDRRRHEPVRDADPLRPRDRPRRGHARRPLHAARPGRARRPAARRASDAACPVVAAGVFNSGLLARDAPARGRHLQLRAGAARDPRARAPDRRRARAPRHDAAGRRGAVRARAPGGGHRLPGRALGRRRSSATPRCSTRRSRSRRGKSSWPKVCSARPPRCRHEPARGDRRQQVLPGREGARGHAARAARGRGARRWWARTAPASRR